MIEIKNAKLIWKNFGGEERPFNPLGTRVFNVVLDNDEIIRELSNIGLAIKVREPRNEGDEPLRTMKVNVKFDGPRPPKVWKVIVDKNGIQKNTVLLNADTVKCLDYTDIKYADMKINPYNWSIGQRSGVSAYLDTLFAIVEEDELEAKYLNIPDEEIPFN